MDLKADVAFLQLEVKQLKGVLEEVFQGLPKYVPEMARELIASGQVSAERVKQIERETADSLSRTKEVMEEEFLRDYGSRLRKVEQKTLA